MQSKSNKIDQWDLAEVNIRERWLTRSPKEFPSKWASEWGFDEYGLWQTFEIAGVQHKMRYISPGTFLMGSPEDEAERQDEEVQHKVTLTEGFWLGETTVSQALWRVILDETPSEFISKGEEVLPVDSVSWGDCQRFCERLSDIFDAEFNLPTEAQWEYACRSGTETPFNTGEQLATEQANYRGSFPYEGRKPLTGQKKAAMEYRKKTVDIHLFPPNQWGLKQMHGNLWEWCRDDWRDFNSDAMTNPMGVLESLSAVLRGGSWLSGGQYCRSACRFRSRRVSRSGRIGLRVSQGISLPEQ